MIPLCCDCGLACCSPVSSRGGEIYLIGGGEGEGEGCLLAGNEVTIIADDGLRLEWERRLLSFFFFKERLFNVVTCPLFSFKEETI